MSEATRWNGEKPKNLGLSLVKLLSHFLNSPEENHDLLNVLSFCLEEGYIDQEKVVLPLENLIKNGKEDVNENLLAVIVGNIDEVNRFNVFKALRAEYDRRKITSLKEVEGKIAEIRISSRPKALKPLRQAS